MGEANSLRLVLHGATIDNGVLELIHNRFVYRVALMPWLALPLKAKVRV